MSAKIQVRSVNPQTCQTLIAAGADPLIARLCAAREVAGPDELLDKLSALLPYTLLKNCETAAVRLADAIEKQENILIVADYDAERRNCLRGRHQRLAGHGCAGGFYGAEPL